MNWTRTTRARDRKTLLSSAKFKPGVKGLERLRAAIEVIFGLCTPEEVDAEVDRIASASQQVRSMLTAEKEKQWTPS